MSKPSKILLGLAGLAGAGIIVSAASAPDPVLTPSPTPRVEAATTYQQPTVASPAFTPVRTTPTPTPAIPAQMPLSNDNYYTNSAGNKVHSPAYADTVPIGASARCRDGTYSFSQSRRGTCSHHGGVASWL